MVIVAVVVIKDGFNAEFDTMDMLCSDMTTIQTRKMNRGKRCPMQKDGFVVVVVGDDNDDSDTT